MGDGTEGGKGEKEEEKKFLCGRTDQPKVVQAVLVDLNIYSMGWKLNCFMIL